MTRPVPTDYQDLVPPEHAGQAAFSATVDLSVRALVGVQDAALDLPEDFDLDEARGPQLDAVGERVGVSRQVEVPIAQGFFSWGTAGRGWSEGYWHEPGSARYGIVALDDETFRLLIRAKIEANHGDGSVGSARRVLRIFLSDPSYGLIVYAPDRGSRGVPDAQPELVIGMASSLPPLVQMILIEREVLPVRPAGARPRVVTPSVRGAPFFGWGMDTDEVQGWGQGAWARGPEEMAAEGDL